MVVYLLIALAVFALDRVTKWIVATRLDLYETVPVIGDFFAITSIRNRGAAFGILQGQQLFFLVVTVVFLVGISWYLVRMAKERKTWTAAGLAMLLGGAVGNFVDRARHGEVVDFFQLHFKFSVFGLDVDYIYPIFNVADIGIVTGAAIVLLHTLVLWRRESRAERGASREASGGPRETEDAANDTV